MRERTEVSAELPWRAAESFAQILQENARQAADAVAFRFLGDGRQAEEITYGGLDQRARAVATRIITATDGGGERVLLLFGPGLDYLAGLFGCFAAGVTAVPAVPPDARLPRTMSRLLAVIEDARADLVLTTSDLAPAIEAWLGSTPGGRSLTVIAIDTIGEADEESLPAVPTHSMALLQYTSGSTSVPRGVTVTHRQLIDNCAAIVRGFGFHAGSSGALWLPHYHDMGLIGGILSPVASRIPMTFMSPVDFLRRPLSWLAMVSRYRATITGGPNFAYDLCVRRAVDAGLDGLDLSSVEVAFNGAEPIRHDTLERFVERFGPYGFRAESFFPCYGLAEATLHVTSGVPLRGCRSVSVSRDALDLEGTARPAAPGESARKLVSCGTPDPDTRLVVVDPVRNDPLDAGGVGEVWTSSPSIASGYWRRPDETASTFGAMTSTGEGPFLRTGDLGFLLDGELFLAGRMKDLIVVNGGNHHAVDIEQVCEAAAVGIRRGCGAAFAVEDDEGSVEHLVVVYEADPDMDQEQHMAAADGIRRAVSMELSVPAHTVVLVAPRTIPKTSSGKVQRWLCRRQYLAGELAELARWVAPARSAVPTPAKGGR